MGIKVVAEAKQSTTHCFGVGGGKDIRRVCGLEIYSCRAGRCWLSFRDMSSEAWVAGGR